MLNGTLVYIILCYVIRGDIWDGNRVVSVAVRDTITWSLNIFNTI